VLLAAFAAPALTPVAAYATPLAQKQARLTAKAKKIRRQLEVLDAGLERTIEQYNLANLRLAEVQAKVEKTTRELKLARKQLSFARKMLRTRLVAMYKQRPIDILDVVFSARSFDELVTDLTTVADIGRHDSNIVDQVERYEGIVADKRTRLVAERAKARRLVAQVQAKKASIEAAIYQRQRMLKGVKKEIDRIERQEAAAAARAAAAANWQYWRSPRMPVGDAGPGHPEVIAIARKYLGIPYVYGAADPRVGFDCSGLVMYCYAQIGIQLPHYSGFQQNMGKPVAMNALIAGDLVFKGYPVSYHVGIYAGNGAVIEAPHTGDVVRYDTVADFQYAVRL
jgi:cell wall-associated NlpC family hydrolase